MKNKVMDENQEPITETSSSDYDSDEELEKILSSIETINPTPLVVNNANNLPLNLMVRQHRLYNWIFQPVNNSDYDIPRLDY